MLTVPHVVVGAALGSLIGDVPGAPVVAFVVGWASHYVLDSVPHWERLYKPFQEIDWETHDPASKWPRHIFVQAALDVVVAFTLLYFLAQTAAVGGVWYASPIFWGGVGASFPDLIGNVPFWNRALRKFTIFKREYDFHVYMHIKDETQKKLPRALGLVTQLVAVTIGLAWLLH